MKKFVIIAAIIIIVALGIAIVAGNLGMSPGETSNSDEFIPDGSGFVSFDGQGPGYGPGPAPNSGDEIPDGPGW